MLYVFEGEFTDYNAVFELLFENTELGIIGFFSSWT